MDGGHPDASYISALYKLLSNADALIQEGKAELLSLRKSKGGLLYLDWCRYKLCKKLRKLHKYHDSDTIQTQQFCTVHHRKQPQNRNLIKCVDCMADFETQYFFE